MNSKELADEFYAALMRGFEVFLQEQEKHSIAIKGFLSVGQVRQLLRERANNMGQGFADRTMSREEFEAYEQAMGQAMQATKIHL